MRPKPNEAVVFRDFFLAGLQFPLEKFVSDVLETFGVQLHQLTPNAIARLSVSVMAMKMTRCDFWRIPLLGFIRSSNARTRSPIWRQMRRCILTSARMSLSQKILKVKIASFLLIGTNGHNGLGIGSITGLVLILMFRMPRQMGGRKHRRWFQN